MPSRMIQSQILGTLRKPDAEPNAGLGIARRVSGSRCAQGSPSFRVGRRSVSVGRIPRGPRRRDAGGGSGQWKGCRCSGTLLCDLVARCGPLVAFRSSNCSCRWIGWSATWRRDHLSVPSGPACAAGVPLSAPMDLLPRNRYRPLVPEGASSPKECSSKPRSQGRQHRPCRIHGGVPEPADG